MDTRREMKKKIIKQALQHVPFEGWSSTILERSVNEIGIDPSHGWRLFPQGAIEAVSCWSDLLDQEMLEALSSPQDLRVREKIALAVKTRLTLLIPYREAARKTMHYLAFPSHVPQASKLLYKTVNEIWYYAGDTSIDHNFYTKRALLGWVYSSTFLYWLGDQSKDFTTTWAFLDHRIDEVLRFSKIPQKIGKVLCSWRYHG